MGDLLWMWNDRDSTHSAAFGWGPVRRNFVKSVLLSCIASHGIVAGCRGNKHAVQRSFISTQRNSLRYSRAQGRRCDGTPPLSETRLGICRRCCSTCCEREGRAAAADIGGTRPRGTARRRRGTRGHHARRCRSPQIGYVAGAAALAASAKAAPLPPISAEHGLAAPRGEGAEPAVTTQDDADRLRSDMSPVLQHLLRARRPRRCRRYRRNTASRHRAAKARNPRSPRKTMPIASSPKRCVGGAGTIAAGTVAATGVGAGVTGAGVAAGTMAGAGVIGAGIAAVGTAAAIGVADTGKAVPRLRC